VTRRSREIVPRRDDTTSFDALVAMAIAQITRNRNTADAYARDVNAWLAFCRSRSISPLSPRPQEVALWMEEMIAADVAPKSRARRMSALCSVYRELRRSMRDRDGRDLAPAVTVPNPFSVDDGPRRERGTHAIATTPLVAREVVLAALGACGDDELGKRDRAIIRVLWATGIRRTSLATMRIEQLQRDVATEGFVLKVAAKGGKRVQILIAGRAAEALRVWLSVLRASGITKGPLWRTKRDTLTASGVFKMLRRRAAAGGHTDPISPHMFRVAFLTHNRATLEAKQDAAGHSDPATTRGYDRATWRGRAAFEGMPEVEDL
jgi:site-specific recombinase XerD